jgi:hypothetical protein
MKKPQDSDPDASLKRAELSRILGSKAFVRAPGMAQFLSYICEKTLAGEGDEIKEYTVGFEALGRGPDFSPKDDAIVRVEANRLRKRLLEYYEGEGKDHPIQISLPPGSYAPVFRVVGPLPAAAPEPGTAVQPQPGDAAICENRLSAIRRRILSPAVAAIAISAALLSIALIVTTERQAESLSDAAERVHVIPASGEEIRILAGSPFARYVDRQGYTWLGDRFFTGGLARSRADALVFRTTDPEIYRHRREGVFQYDIPLKPGVYELRLHFAELVYGEERFEGGGEASRQVRVRINDQLVLPNLDVMSDAGGDSSALVKVLTDVSPTADGFVHLAFQSNQANNAVVSGIEILPGLPGKMRAVRISTRSTPYYDSDKIRWDADSYYRGGRTLSRLTAIKTSQNAELYQTERFGNFSYSIPVAAQGTYTINLRFCENYFGDTHPEEKAYGERLFSVYCNGEALLRNLDIMREAGGSQIPLKKSFRHKKPSAQGNFLIHFVPVKNYASVSAIEVLPE